MGCLASQRLKAIDVLGWLSNIPASCAKPMAAAVAEVGTVETTSASTGASLCQATSVAALAV
eukprot:m.130003 g.130003  ORF g.130003 m.130003 type:complete len:62 (-) comp15867_c0_seq3:1149-1334(-)